MRHWHVAVLMTFAWLNGIAIGVLVMLELSR